jgi:hypothetical protein
MKVEFQLFRPDTSLRTNTKARHWQTGELKWFMILLEEADLSNADLRNADLNMALLAKANLARADVRGTDLRNAILDGARLDSRKRTIRCDLYQGGKDDSSVDRDTQCSIR